MADVKVFDNDTEYGQWLKDYSEEGYYVVNLKKEREKTIHKAECDHNRPSAKIGNFTDGERKAGSGDRQLLIDWAQEHAPQLEWVACGSCKVSVPS